MNIHVETNKYLCILNYSQALAIVEQFFTTLYSFGVVIDTRSM